MKKPVKDTNFILHLVHPATLDEHARKKRRARITHPGKRNRP